MPPPTKDRKMTVYLGDRKLLRLHHPYHRLQKAFNGEHDFDIAPKPLTGEEIYQRK